MTPTWHRAQGTSPLYVDRRWPAAGQASRSRWLTISASATSAILVSALVCASPIVAGETDFVRDVKPILVANCYKCHGPDKQESGFRLDRAADLLAGGNSGPAIVAGNVDESLLIRAVMGAEDVTKMPPKGPPLEPAQIDLLKRWVADGAKVPSDTAAPAAQRSSDHWSFQPLARSVPPAVKHQDKVRSPIDAFVLARLEAAGLEPSGEADRATLIRRLSLDLIGLPPTVDEVERFVADTASDAYAEAIYALDAGFFDSAGLDVDVANLANGTAIVTGIITGALDIGIANTFTLANAHNHGLPLVMIAGFLTGALSFINTALAFVPALVVTLLLQWILCIARIVQALPFAQSTFAAFPLWLALLMYVPLTVSAVYLLKQK